MVLLTTNDLPLWMRPRRRTIDWGLLIVLGCCLLTCWSLLARPGLPRGTSAELYEFRASEVARHVWSGVLYTRWASFMNYGYGSPVFNYLPPLPHYLAGYYQAITDASPENSIKILLILSIVGAGVGMYLFVRERFGPAAGLLSALVYLYSPPILLTLPYTVGEVSLLMALALLPLCLWSLQRHVTEPTGFRFALAALLLTTLILTDARMALLGGILLVAFLLLNIQHLRTLLLIAVTAGLLTAFFWLPALTERDLITWTSYNPEPLEGTLPLSELFLPFQRYDLRLINPPPNRAPGLAAWGLAGLGALTYFMRRRVDILAFFVLGCAAMVFSTPPFAAYWPVSTSFLPLLPYHAVLIGVCCFSIVAGSAVVWCDRVPKLYGLPILTLFVLLAVPLAFAVNGLYPPEWQSTLRDVRTPIGVNAEINQHAIGSFYTGILLPTTAPAIPPAQTTMTTGILSERAPAFNRFPVIVRPEHAFDLIPNTPLSERYVFGSAVAVPVELELFNFPGWRVTINGEDVPLGTSTRGFITVALPAGTLDFHLWFDATPVRNWAWGLSALGCLFLVVFTRSRWWSRETSPVPVGELPPTARFSALLAFLSIVVITWTVHQSPGVILPNSTDQQFFGLSNQSPVALGQVFDSIYLLGYSVNTPENNSSRLFGLTLYWEAGRSIDFDAQSEVRLVGPIGDSAQVSVLSQAHRHPGDIPTTRWRASLDVTEDPSGPDIGPGYIHDDFNFAIPAGTPSGDYLVQVVLDRCATATFNACGSAVPIPAIDPITKKVINVVTLPQVIFHLGSR
jgi:hypothetical protein